MSGTTELQVANQSMPPTIIAQRVISSVPRRPPSASVSVFEWSWKDLHRSKLLEGYRLDYRSAASRGY